MPDELPLARTGRASTQHDNDSLASWIDSIGDRFHAIAIRLRDRPAAELVDELVDFAHRRPGAFLGGAFLIGLAVARVAKSSPPRPSRGPAAWRG